MTTHLYTLCWNEADMLEFFFRNYDPWVDRYIVFDDGSTDGSIEILKSRPKVELRKWRRKYADSYLMSQLDWLNEVWKESRGSADWAVMVDIDEHLFVPRSPMADFLGRYKSQGITLVPALGFQILSEEFPAAGEHLTQSRTWGKPWEWSCKLSIFDPNAIEETNFTSGRHTAKAAGNVKLPHRDELLLFHYKYLGFERTFENQNAQYANIGSHDIAVMEHYAWTRKQLRDHWDKILKGSEDMSWPNYDPKTYPYFCRWWLFLGVLYFVTRWFRRARKFFHRPVYMLERLKAFCVQDKIGLFIEEINRSPIRKEIYRLIMEEGANGNGGNTVVAANGADERGVVIQCLHSVDMNKPQGAKDIQSFIAEIKENEEKYQKTFDAFVITNSENFTKSAVEFAKNNNVKLVSRKDLVEFISQVNVSRK